MQYAVIDGDGRLQMIFDVEDGQPVSWVGQDEGYRLLLAGEFTLHPQLDYGDHVWDGKKFVPDPDALARLEEGTYFV